MSTVCSNALLTQKPEDVTRRFVDEVYFPLLLGELRRALERVPRPGRLFFPPY